MKALILKDAYVIWRQMRLFVACIAVMSLVGGTFNTIFLVVWASMLPYTAMAYDDRSHWDQLAAMMPYSPWDIVLSKYVLGLICMAGFTAVNLIIRSAGALIGGPALSEILSGDGGSGLYTLLLSLFAGVVSMDVTMPLIFRFGPERGRMAYLVVVFGAAIGIGAVLGGLEGLPGIPAPLMALAPLAAVLATLISIPLSVKAYRARS